jgi:hypothetical protein
MVCDDGNASHRYLGLAMPLFDVTVLIYQLKVKTMNTKTSSRGSCPKNIIVLNTKV